MSLCRKCEANLTNGLDIIGKKILCRANQSPIVFLIHFILKSYKTLLLFSKLNVIQSESSEKKIRSKKPRMSKFSIYQRMN